MIRGVRFVAVLILAAGPAWCKREDADIRVAFPFPKPYQSCSALCTSTAGGPINVVINGAKGAVVGRLVLRGIPTAPVEMRPVRLEGHHGTEIQAVIVEASGGSASHIHVFELHPKPLRAKKLFHGLHKGGVDYRYDSNSRLIGMNFSHAQWHVGLAEGPVMGHVYTAQNVAWLPGRQAFRKGPVYVDTQAEETASLLDLLYTPGAHKYLGIDEADTGDDLTHVFFFRPVGLLGRKTTAGFRGSDYVRAVVRWREVEKENYISRELKSIDLFAADHPPPRQ